jgi:Holliday junction resolvasome RuvABC endonuclease subunit
MTRSPKPVNNASQPVKTPGHDRTEITMDRIAGLDLSLTSCGIGVITRRSDHSCIANCTTITSRGKRDDGLPQRAARIAALAADVVRPASTASLVVLEGPSYGSRGGSPLDRHGLWWRVAGELLERGVPLAVCAPATRAKFAAGSGKADKAAVSSAVSRLWPQLDISNADEADAVVLAHTGAVRLGWDVVTLERHRDALAAIRWPAGLAELAAVS